MSDFDEKIVVMLARIGARVEEIGAQVTAIRAQQSGIVHRLNALDSSVREASIYAQNAWSAAGDLYNLAIDFDEASRRGAHERH